MGLLYKSWVEFCLHYRRRQTSLCIPLSLYLYRWLQVRGGARGYRCVVRERGAGARGPGGGRTGIARGSAYKTDQSPCISHLSSYPQWNSRVFFSPEGSSFAFLVFYRHFGHKREKTSETGFNTFRIHLWSFSVKFNVEDFTLQTTGKKHNVWCFQMSHVVVLDFVEFFLRSESFQNINSNDAQDI